MSIRENGNNVINEMYEQPAVRPSGWGGDRAEPTATTASPRRSARVSDVEKREERRREGGREGGREASSRRWSLTFGDSI